MQKYWEKILNFCESRKELLHRGLLAIVFLGLIGQFAFLSGFLLERADHHSIVASQDNDSGAGIDVASRTYLITDTGWRAYGPSYYRLSALIRHFATLISDGTERSPEQLRSRSVFMHLMLINLLSIYALAFTLMFLLSSSLVFQALGTLVLVSTLLRDPTRAELLFIAKPEFLSTLLIALSFFTLLLWSRAREQTRPLKIAAMIWGLAASVKMNVLLFAPGVLVFFLPLYRDRQALIQSLKTYLVWSLGTYFVVGFPQTWAIWGTLEYLAHQQWNFVGGDLEFLKIWIGLFQSQLAYSALALIFFSLLSPLKDWKCSWRQLGLLALAILLPTAYLISRRMHPPYEWYPFPFVALLLVLLAVSLSKLQLRFNKPFKNHPIFQLLAIVAIPLLLPAVPQVVTEKLKSRSICRTEASTLEEVINQAAQRGFKILVDPLIPYDQKWHGKQVDLRWDMDLQALEPFSMLALRRDYYLAYLTKAEGGAELVQNHLRDLEQTRTFYRTFHNKTEAVDAQGRTWKRVYQDDCFFELWTKE